MAHIVKQFAVAYKALSEKEILFKINNNKEMSQEERKDLLVVIPDGYEIDRANSTFEHIVFKKKNPPRWRDLPTAKEIESKLKLAIAENDFSEGGRVFATEMIAKIMRFDSRFGGVVTPKEWEYEDVNGTYDIKVIDCNEDGITIQDACALRNFLAFHTTRQAELFLRENRDLVNMYYNIN